MSRDTAEDWLRFLADAGERLCASLEINATLATVTGLAVPRLADWAAIHVREGDAIRTIAVSHAEGREDLVWEMLRRYPANLRSRYGFPQVIRTGLAELLPDVTPDILDAVSVDAENRRLLDALDLRTEICVPLSARGEVFGALTLATTSSSGRRLDVTDLERAGDLARRCATAIDNARLYQVAQEAVVARDEFLSVAAHELRTPLAALLLAAHSLDRTARDHGDERVMGRIERVNRQLLALKELVDRLLDVSSMEGTEFRVKPAEMDLAELVREVADRFRPDIRRAQSTLDIVGPASLVGHWDRLRIDQVLTNLLANAVKFSPGRPITVILEPAADEVAVVVRDQGVGIDREKQPLVFDRWARGVSARSFGGLGLGLYVTRRIVEAHGGRIEVASEPGAGSTFTVWLPWTGNVRPD